MDKLIDDAVAKVQAGANPDANIAKLGAGLALLVVSAATIERAVAEGRMNTDTLRAVLRSVYQVADTFASMATRGLGLDASAVKAEADRVLREAPIAAGVIVRAANDTVH